MFVLEPEERCFLLRLLLLPTPHFFLTSDLAARILTSDFDVGHSFQPMRLTLIKK